ncbi:fungal-specific transcription factor domain-containing protein [Stachybotrys elegans]|uniref:Fungal-specific transcription factor domain-containing protein n=1 Tax=Stachybotrys elegans TaxID=80388 RepID=A0A8K0SHN2_9HYPO|nr:fungal-specific transcription factor domain-containing protein [Stachybotrys elegans]
MRWGRCQRAARQQERNGEGHLSWQSLTAPLPAASYLLSLVKQSVMQRLTRAQAASRAACASCHQRKVKCDAHDVGLPCSNCKAALKDDCRIHQKRKRASKSTRVASPEFSQQRVENTPRILRPGSSASADLLSSPLTTHVEEHTLTPASAGVTGLDVRAAEDGEYLCKRHLVEFIDQPELVDRPIDSTARMTYIGTDVSNINYLVRQQYGAQVNTSEVCHYPTNRIARRLSSHGPADRLPLDALQLPSRAVVDELLDAFFCHINPGFPVVDETIFLQQYRGRDPSNPPSLVLLQSILVAGAHVLYHRHPEKRNSYKRMFFRRAKTLLDVGFERNRDTIVQAALLLTWHIDGVEDVTANAWHWIGIASRTAMGLGMHRDAQGSTLVPHNKRMWRRVWWLLFQSDLWISLQYGRPPSIHLDDCNVQQLQASDFLDCGHQAQSEYHIQMSLLAAILSEALRARLRASGTGAWLPTLKKTDERLATWALHLPQQLRLNSTSRCPIWSSNLHLHYNMALILLHRLQPHPSPESTSDEAARNENVRICVTAAGTVQSIFQTLRESDSLKCLWMSVINCLFTALIQISTEVRTTNPLLAISALRRYDSALESLKDLSRYWPNAESILHFFERPIRDDSPAAQAGGQVGKVSQASSQQMTAVPSVVYENSQDHMALQHEYSGYQAVQAEATKHTDTCLPPGQPVGHAQEMPNLDLLGVRQQDQAETEDMLENWKQWQQDHWQTPEFSDEFLFTF